MDQIGKIIAVDGDSAVVELERNSACEKCGICHMGETQKVQLSVLNGIGAAVGQRVLIELDKRSVLKAGSIVYLVPLAGLLAGIGIMYLVDRFVDLPGSPDWWGIGVGFLLFGLIFLGIRLREPVWKGKPEYNPAIVRIVEEYEEITDFCGHKDDE